MHKRKAESDSLVEEAKVHRTRGSVKVDKLPHRMSGQKWPTIEGYSRVNCTSGSPGVWKQLSPMKLGPINPLEFGWDKATDHGEKEFHITLPALATNLENLWQASKVWQGEEESLTKLPMPVFFERRASIWQDQKAHRWIKKGTDASGNKNIALYSLWGDKKLSYIEARKKIYCPIYAALVKKTEAYKRLEARLDAGESILLLEFDGYDRGNKSLKECLEDHSRPFGHSLVLECLLTGIEPWNDEK